MILTSDLGCSMPVTVLVPGYGGRLRFVERWRMSIAVHTLDRHGGGRLVVSGHNGEAERLAALAPVDADVVLETEAQSTFDNVANSIKLLVDASAISIASDRFHRRRALGYVADLDDSLMPRVIDPDYAWRDGWWMDLGGGGYELFIWARRKVKLLCLRWRQRNGLRGSL